MAHCEARSDQPPVAYYLTTVFCTENLITFTFCALIYTSVGTAVGVAVKSALSGALATLVGACIIIGGALLSGTLFSEFMYKKTQMTNKSTVSSAVLTPKLKSSNISISSSLKFENNKIEEEKEEEKKEEKGNKKEEKNSSQSYAMCDGDSPQYSPGKGLINSYLNTI